MATDFELGGLPRYFAGGSSLDDTELCLKGGRICLQAGRQFDAQEAMLLLPLNLRIDANYRSPWLPALNAPRSVDRGMHSVEG